MRRWYLVLAGVCTFWGTIPLTVRDVPLDGVAITFVRVWVASAVLGAGLALAKRATAGPRLFSYAPLRCAVAGAVLAAHWSAMFAAYKRAPADAVIFIVFLSPIGIALLASVVLGERVRTVTAAALGLAVVGLVFIATPSARGGDSAGLALAGIAAATFAVLIVVAKPLAEVYGGARLALMEMTGAGVFLVPAALAAEWGRPRPSWAWLVVLGVVHTALATGAYLAALARVPATHAGILGYLEPVGVVVFSWLVVGDEPAPATVIGGMLILAAGVLIVRSAGETREERIEGVPG